MASTSSMPPPIQASEPRLCWICQQDETEDEAPTLWKAPCPCSLTAHDSCLLEWITSQELAKKNEGNYNASIQCPQCQATIVVERPHDYIVHAYTALDGIIGACVIPTALSGLLGCVYSGFLVYGMNTVQMVFGRVDAERMLSNMYPSTSLSARWLELTRETLRWSVTMFDPFFPEIKTNSDWRIFIGLPLIGPCLILSRTKFADRALPLLLPLYFLDPRHQRIDFTRPLTPGFAFATLPYVRAAYNKTYGYFISPYEKKWDQAVLRQPREGETAADIAAEAQDQGAVIEIQVVDQVVVEEDGVGNFEVVGQPEEQDVRPEAFGAQDGDAPQVDGQQLPPVQAIRIPQPPNAEPEEAQQPNADPDNWQIRQDIPLRQVMITTMGALFFPTVASYSGEVLKHALPERWIYSYGLRSAGWNGGLLREKWGRTIIGGCLFVLLKDAVTLYVKWKRARDFGKRKILDYTGPRRRSD